MYRKILVGTDGSATAARAVERAVDVARIHDAALTILTAGHGEKAQQVVAAAAAAHDGSGVAIDTRVVDQDPATALVSVAEEGGYDLLVTGNKGMTGARRFLLGSVPNKVGHHIPCSFLVVRTT
jgi:nucleotide-binding universal stress UspA family protein